jgi:hypothetical protein
VVNHFHLLLQYLLDLNVDETGSNLAKYLSGKGSNLFPVDTQFEILPYSIMSGVSRGLSPPLQ